jgi:hypothetical protein
VHSFGKDGRKLIRWGRTAVDPALAKITTKPEEHVRDGLRLDTLGYGEQTEAIAETDDGCSNLTTFAGVGDRTYEASVDLELVEGKRLEMSQA